MVIDDSICTSEHVGERGGLASKIKEEGKGARRGRTVQATCRRAARHGNASPGRFAWAVGANDDAVPREAGDQRVGGGGH
jgi:hypothetical protein